MKYIINGKIVLPDGVVEGKALAFDKKIINITDKAEAGAEVIDAKGGLVIPGLVDMHIHGCFGEDASDGSEDGIRVMAKGILKSGVTSWLPTTMTVSKPELEKAFGIIKSLREESKSWDGAEILGINSEGPFINPKKKGAQAEENIIAPDAAFVKKYADIIKVITIAPEMDQDFACIEELSRDTDILISMGHTDATYEQACAAVTHGVNHVTHLFNAQTALQHRNPGVVGAAFTNDVTCELIADTFHVHKGLFQLVANIKGDKLILITDSTRAGGMPDGEYTLGGQKIFVKGIECRLEDGTIAGSVLQLNNALKNFKANTDLPLHKIVALASLNPATAIGAADRKGSLEVGKDADIVITDESFAVQKTFIGGVLKYEA